MTQLTRLSADSGLSAVLDAIDRDGACILTGVLADHQRQSIVEEVSPYIAQTAHGDKAFSGDRTRRTGALVARAPAVREIVMSAPVLNVAEAFLLNFADRIQLNLTQTIAIEPGQGNQPLHRDRLGWGNYSPREIEPQFNAIWALSPFTHENGATRVVPGSHRWSWERTPLPTEVCAAEMEAGSVLLHTGTVLHGGGENLTQSVRLGLNLTYCLGWLRQEENQYLSCPPDIARHLPAKLQALLGYTQGNYALGYYSDPDGRDSAEAGILAPETALGAQPQTDWVFTEKGYKDESNF